MRIGYQGFSARIWSETPSLIGPSLDTDKDMYLQKMGYMYIHGDFLWNISNAFSGYRETRFWNFVPYLHAGFFRSYGLEDVNFADNELAMGAGLLHNLRLGSCIYIITCIAVKLINRCVTALNNLSSYNKVKYCISDKRKRQGRKTCRIMFLISIFLTYYMRNIC